MGTLRRGFKTDAERIAEAVRGELGLSPTSPLDCMAVCEKLGIPVVKVSDLTASGAATASVKCINSPQSQFSAMTVAFGTKRIIVYNPRHPAGRRANSVSHEISHILLEHPMSPALGAGGCRRWNQTLEDEADWQAGALLVPRQAALEWMDAGGSLEDGAIRYGVSLPLFRWRAHQTGVLRQLEARTRFRPQ